MKQLEIHCGNCRGRLEVSIDVPQTQVICPLCNVELSVHAFPALFDEAARNAAPARVLLADESSCYFHPQNQAVVPCDQCGRFLCALCEISEGNGHYCPACFSKRNTREGGERPNYLTRQDHVALSLAVLPILFFPLTIVTAPAVLYLVVRHWNKPISLIQRRRRTTFILAAGIALAQLALWGTFLGMFILGIALGDEL